MLRPLLAALAAASLAACDRSGNEAAETPNGAAAESGSTAKAGARTTILETLSGSGSHATFANAVKAAGLTETLSGAQPYTVFAPTDAGFGKLPPGTANGLLEPDRKGQLVALLTGHIVTGVITAADLGRAIDKGNGKAQLATVGGTTLTFSRSDDAIAVSDGSGQSGKIERSDLLQSNGVIHGVDTVLSPPQ